MIIQGSNDEPERSPCCKICISKLLMGQFYLEPPDDQPQAGSLKERINRREEKVTNTHGNLRQRQREMTQVNKQVQELTVQNATQDEKQNEREQKL